MSNKKTAEDAKLGTSNQEKIVIKKLNLVPKKIHSQPTNQVDLFANNAYNILKKVITKPIEEVTPEILEEEETSEKQFPKQDSIKFISKIIFEKIEEEDEFEPYTDTLSEKLEKIIHINSQRKIEQADESKPKEFGEEENILDYELNASKGLEPIEEKIDEFLEKIKLDPIEIIEPEIVDVVEEEEVHENKAPTEEIINLLKATEVAEITKSKLTSQIKRLIQVKYDTIQNKASKLLLFCNHFEKETKDLEQQAIQVIRESFESIDDIKDSVRRESLKENDVGYKLQKLKNKVMELNEINNKVGRYLTETDGQYTEIGLATIRELANKSKPLEHQYKGLENLYFSLMQEQTELTSTLNFRTRILRITRADRDSDLKKLQTTQKILEQRRKEILEQLECAKMSIQENTVSEKTKYNKMTEELRQLSDKSKILLREKISLQNENSYLQDKIHKVMHELDFLQH